MMLNLTHLCMSIRLGNPVEWVPSDQSFLYGTAVKSTGRVETGA